MPEANRCARCGRVNMPGLLICAACGLNLARSFATQQIGKEPVPDNLRSVGTVRFPDKMRLVVHIGEAVTVVDIDEQITVGRGENGQTGKPDLDLAPYDAFKLGASRWHAIITRNNQMLTITDTGSTNGSWLNSERLKVGEPKILADGDTVWLGQLELIVYFHYGSDNTS